MEPAKTFPGLVVLGMTFGLAEYRDAEIVHVCLAILVRKRDVLVTAHISAKPDDSIPDVFHETGEDPTVFVHRIEIGACRYSPVQVNIVALDENEPYSS